MALSATRGKASPSLKEIFQPCFMAVLKASFQPCLLAGFKEQMFLCFFFFLQMPINRQATEEYSIPHHSNPKSSFVIPLKESQESSREERKIGSEN